jgi:peptide/nickel transport system permease protein
MTSASSTAERAADAQHTRALTPTQLAIYRAARHKGLIVGSGIMLGLLLCAVFAPLIAPYDPIEADAAIRLMPPFWQDGGDWAHLFGTDAFGRDVFSRVIYGARVSLGISIAVATISMVIGTTIGLVGGYLGGRVDAFVMYLITTKLAMPQLVVLLALLSVFGGSVFVLIAVIAALGWDRYAMVIRPLAMRLRRQEFAVAAEVIGASRLRIMFSELLPNLFDQILVIMTVEMGLVIIIEAAISFLGLGLPPPMPSLGLMIAEGRDYMFFLPYLMVIPGLVIFLAEIAIYLVGDGVGDVFAPDERRS